MKPKRPKLKRWEIRELDESRNPPVWMSPIEAHGIGILEAVFHRYPDMEIVSGNDPSPGRFTLKTSVPGCQFERRILCQEVK